MLFLGPTNSINSKMLISPDYGRCQREGFHQAYCNCRNRWEGTPQEPGGYLIQYRRAHCSRRIHLKTGGGDPRRRTMAHSETRTRRHVFRQAMRRHDLA
ncbi:hypothetical protein CaCOL14_008193 [Colletotrichum acutatum]